MREVMIEALKKHAEGHIEKHRANVEVLMQKPVGVAEHPDTLETIEKEAFSKNFFFVKVICHLVTLEPLNLCHQFLKLF